MHGLKLAKRPFRCREISAAISMQPLQQHWRPGCARSAQRECLDSKFTMMCMQA